MGVQRVEGLEGGVGGDGYGAVAAGEEEVGWRGGVVEGALVCLKRWGVRGLGGWGRVDGDGDEGIILVGRLHVSWRTRWVDSTKGQGEGEHTFRPTITTLPSAAHAIVNPSPPSCTVAVHVLLLTSQNLHVPSLLTDANSASFVGFQATRSTPPVCPLNSVLFFTCGFSGFHIRSVRSAEPVAIRWPVGFQAMVRILAGRQEGWRRGRAVDVRTCGSLGLERQGLGMFGL